MKSSLTGLISSSYDISFCVLSLFVSFFGERGHKPRWLAFASFMIGLGALVFSLPHFFSGRYELGTIFEGKVSVTFFVCINSQDYIETGLLTMYSKVRSKVSPAVLCELCKAGEQRDGLYAICGSPGLRFSASLSPSCAPSPFR